MEANPDTVPSPAWTHHASAGRQGADAGAGLHGRLGSTEVARRNWEHSQPGRVAGITVVCGENVCGIDPKLEGLEGQDQLRPGHGPPHRDLQALAARYGEMLVQMNVETRVWGSPSTSSTSTPPDHRAEVGQGAKCIGGGSR